MNEFADELRASREARHISLTEVSSATKIQLKYLRAMEEGDFTFLPRPYVRAFISDYAKAIQIDPAATLAKYEASTKVLEKSVGEPQPEYTGIEQATPIRHDLQKRMAETSPLYGFSVREFLSNQASKKKWLPVAALILLIAIVALVANITRNGRNEQVSETPFEQIVKEKERASPAHPSGAMPSAGASMTSNSYSDSLILEGRTSQEVWVRLLIDEGSPKEYLLRPKVVRTWKAKENFRVSLGNAGGITFQLNGKDLGMLGKAGAVVRNTVITRSGVQK
jgi:cytoskeleton protein RodZ